MVDMNQIIEGLEQAKNVIERWVQMFEKYNSPAVIDEAIAMPKQQETVVRCKDYKHKVDTVKQFYEMDINELCKLAHEQQVEIEVRIEPTEYEQTNSTFTIQPWEKYGPSFCPYGQPIVYAKEKQEG